MPNAKRILLIDSIPMFRELGRVFLSRSGPVDTADSAEQAFRIAARRPPAVVIADMHLPDFPSDLLVRRFKSQPGWGAPPVVLLARPDAAEDHARAVRAGAADVLFKPLQRDVLISAIRRLIRDDRPRGLPRARIDQRIEILTRGRRIQGTLRNLSRGGAFVDGSLPMVPTDEVGLEFHLEREDRILAPTARVVWSRHRAEGPDSAGLRFLSIDARTVERIDHYVSDHFPVGPSLPA